MTEPEIVDFSQCFEIAGLVFACENENEDDFVSQEDESDIKSRFTKILLSGIAHVLFGHVLFEKFVFCE